ncbi:beta-1,4 N-acetylgalactosaminyltransferase 1-like [Branchiostoma lanceolatum]|uniref:beta-1,4 N-acetylgalactosaminyltransferase 1-like n=1 Tax=Branchiostoma lanceolatum TaxID=7740 RepID=UPI003454B90E
MTGTGPGKFRLKCWTGSLRQLMLAGVVVIVCLLIFVGHCQWKEIHRTSSSQLGKMDMIAESVENIPFTWRNETLSLLHDKSRCDCSKSKHNLWKDVDEKDRAATIERRSKELTKYNQRVESSKETLMIVDGAAPLSYPVRGLTVVPEGTAELPGLVVLDETARQEYEVQLQTTDFGVLDTVAEVAQAQLEGLRTKSLTIRSKSLSRLNRQLQFIVYTNTVYDIDATEIINFRYLHHRVSVPLRIRVRTVPFLYDPGPDNDISRKITIITKTFIRYASIRKLLSSIRKFYPNIRVVVADDSRPVEDLQAENVDHFVMPFAAGWFAGRNLAVSQVTTPYLLWVDDDFVFVPETKLENLLEVLENTKLDLVAGTVGRTGIRYTKMDIVPGDENGDCLRIHDLHHWGPVPGFPQCRLSTRVTNFFLARTDSVRAVGFDPVYTRSAHTQFFMAAIGRLRVASCDHVRIDHVSDKPAEYKKFRNEGGDYTKVSQRHEFFKHSIQCWVNR